MTHKAMTKTAITKAAAAVSAALDTVRKSIDAGTDNLATVKLSRWDTLKAQAQRIEPSAAEALAIAKLVETHDRKTGGMKVCAPTAASGFAATLACHAELDGFDTAFAAAYPDDESRKGIQINAVKARACRARYDGGSMSGDVWDVKAFVTDRNAQAQKQKDAAATLATVDGLGIEIAKFLKRKAKAAGMTEIAGVDVGALSKGLVDACFKAPAAEPAPSQTTTTTDNAEPETETDPAAPAPTGVDPASMEEMMKQMMPQMMQMMMANTAK